MDPELEKLVGPSPDVQKVAGGFTFTEGPAYSRLGYLLFSDIPAARIMKWEAGSVTVFRENSNGANGLTFDHQGKAQAIFYLQSRDNLLEAEHGGHFR